MTDTSPSPGPSVADALRAIADSRPRNQRRIVTITQEALVQRMRRRCARDGETFHVTRCRCAGHSRDMGAFYITTNNVITTTYAHVESLVEDARELGVLKPYEVVEGVEEVTS